MGSIIILGLLLLVAVAGLIAWRIGSKGSMSRAEFDRRSQEIRDDKSLDSYEKDVQITGLHRRYNSDPSSYLRRGGKIALAADLALLIVFGFFSSFKTVPTKDVGVVTSFGKPVDYLPNGPTWWPPGRTSHCLTAPCRRTRTIAKRARPLTSAVQGPHRPSDRGLREHVRAMTDQGRQGRRRELVPATSDV